jgi:hypothetical protein
VYFLELDLGRETGKGLSEEVAAEWPLKDE